MENATVFGLGPKTEVTASLTIKEFVKVIESTEPGKFYEGNEFMVKEVPMCLEVYPKGWSKEYRGKVGVFVRNMSQVEVKVKLQFLTDVRNSKMEEKTMQAGQGKGYFSFIFEDEVQKHYKEKDFVVKVKLEMEGEVVKISGENMEESRKRKSISQDITEVAYKKMSWTDFTLEFEGKELPCHRLVLAGASPVLAAMLENQHREAKEGRAAIDLPAAVGRAFVRYIYLEEIEEGILKEEVVTFLELGEKYQVEKLKELAEEKMMQLLDKGTMVKFLMAGDLFRAARIKAAALRLGKLHLAWLRGEGRGELRELPQELLIELL